MVAQRGADRFSSFGRPEYLLLRGWKEKYCRHRFALYIHHATELRVKCQAPFSLFLESTWGRGSIRTRGP